MPEVLDLRELGGDDSHGHRQDSPATPAAAGEPPVEDERPSAPKWRRRVAIALVVALAAGVAYMLTAGRPAGTPPPPVVADTAPPAQRAAAQALDAWARFASTGDLSVLDGAFDPAGPQMAALRTQAPALAKAAAAGAYTFGADMLSVGRGGNPDEQLVVADVVLSRPGEADQRFAWEIVMRRSEQSGAWLLWTVRDRATPGGAP